MGTTFSSKSKEYSNLKDKLNLDQQPRNPKPDVRKPCDIKKDVLHQLHHTYSGFDTHFGKGGVAFYTPLKETPEKHINSAKPLLSNSRPNRHSQASNSFTTVDRELMANIILEENLKEKGKSARKSEERRVQALKRIEKREEEIMRKHTEKMTKIEEKKQALRDQQKKQHTHSKRLF